MWKKIKRFFSLKPTKENESQRINALLRKYDSFVKAIAKCNILDKIDFEVRCYDNTEKTIVSFWFIIHNEDNITLLVYPDDCSLRTIDLPKEMEKDIKDIVADMYRKQKIHREAARQVESDLIVRKLQTHWTKTSTETIK